MWSAYSCRSTLPVYSQDKASILLVYMGISWDIERKRKGDSWDERRKEGREGGRKKERERKGGRGERGTQVGDLLLFLKQHNYT